MEVLILCNIELYIKKESFSRQEVPIRASDDEYWHNRRNIGCSSSHKESIEVQLETGINNLGWAISKNAATINKR